MTDNDAVPAASGRSKSSISGGVTSIIAAAIGGLILFGATSAYTDIYKQPLLSINLTPHGIINNNNSTTTFVDEISLKNQGHRSANNVRLTINVANARIINYSTVLITESITKTRIEE